MGRYAAFFDFDGTLIRGDSQEIEMRYMLGTGRRPYPDPFVILKTIITGILSHFNLCSQLYFNSTYNQIYNGMSEHDAADIGKKIFELKIKDLFNSEALAMLEKHRKDGAVIVIVSATPGHILEPVRSFIKPDFVICTVLETDRQKKYTGHSVGGICIEEEKVRRIRDLSEKQNIDLLSSFAYSDHHADIPLLEAVGYPSVVNPTGRLKRYALKRKWPVYRSG